MSRHKYEQAWVDAYPPDPRQRRRQLGALHRFEKAMERNAIELLDKALESTHGCKEAEDLLTEYGMRLRRSGSKESSARQWISVVKSFFVKNHARIGNLPCDIATHRPHPTIATLPKEHVNRMIQTRDNVQDQLVIAFLAQTGQRIGVLTAMKKVMIKKKGPEASPYGLVEVNIDDLVDPKGRNVNRSRVHYIFVIGRQAMQLVKRMPDYPGGWLFDISERQIARIVNKAGTDADVQKRRQTGFPKRFMYTVHSNAFRSYWKDQMKEGGVKDSDMLNFLMGNKLTNDRTSLAFSEQEALDAYKTAEKNLKLDFRPASKKRRTRRGRKS